MFCSNEGSCVRFGAKKRRQMTPRPVQHGGGVELAPCSSRLEPNVSASRSRLQRSTVHGELAVVVHYPTRQVFDQLLADHATLLACHFCDCLRDSVDDFICFFPAGETVARSTWRTRCRARSCFSVSAADTFTSVRPVPIAPPFHPARLRPFNRHTLEPAAASRCEPTHPSPSAC